MKKADKPVVIVKGNNINGDFKVSITETSSKTPAAIAFAIAVIVAASVLAVSHCCPELLADFVRWLVCIAIGS